MNDRSSTRRSFLKQAGAAAGAAAAALTGATARAVAPYAADREESALRARTAARNQGFRLGPVLYRNPLRSPSDLAGFRIEGRAVTSFPDGRLRLANALDPSFGQKSNFVAWFPVELPGDFAASWDFRALREPGLCIVFFAARARSGADIFAPGLRPRTGDYRQYHHGDIDTLHLAYFRRKQRAERAFHVCNLRKSYGFHLVAEGPDPLPSVIDAAPPYRIELIKCGPDVAFSIDGLPILSWHDDGQTYGPVLAGGRLGFRQMAPLVAEYENLEVRKVTRT